MAERMRGRSEIHGFGAWLWFAIQVVVVGWVVLRIALNIIASLAGSSDCGPGEVAVFERDIYAGAKGAYGYCIPEGAPVPAGMMP